MILEYEFDVPEHAFGDLPYSTEARRELSKRAMHIKTGSTDCDQDHKDEMAWSTDVVYPVLGWETGKDRTTSESPFTTTQYM